MRVGYRRRPLRARPAAGLRLWPATSGVLLLAAVLWALSGWVDAALLSHDWPGSWAALAVPLGLTAAFAVAELVVLHVELGRNAYSLSLSELPFVVGLFLSPPLPLLLARIAGGLFALGLRRRQRAHKLFFNLAAWSMEGSVTLVTFAWLTRLLGTATAVQWLAATLAILLGTMQTSTAVAMAIKLHTGEFNRELLRGFLVSGAFGALTSCVAGVVAVGALTSSALEAGPLLGLAAAGLVGYRAYSTLRQRHSSLELLYDFTRALTRSSAGSELMTALLDQVRVLLRAESAELIVVLPGAEGRYTRSTLRADGTLVTSAYAPGPLDGPWSRVIDEDALRMITSSTRDEAAQAYLSAHGLRDCIVAPLHADGAVVGTLAVANRIAEFATFTSADAKLFQTVAAQAAVALENGRLVDRLSHDSNHDALTGLANRALFRRRCTELLATAPQQPLAVLLMDLDRFKEVNDTLGHHHGDLLLVELAARLLEHLDAAATVARLGGDEFAVLVPRAGAAAAAAAAAAITTALAQPFQLEGVCIEVEASIGIALSPDHGEHASVLLQRADVAMYAAKTAGSTAEFYDSSRDEHSPRRLMLASQLRQAIDDEQLVLYYQPQARADDRRVTGVEALIRWNHPTYGLIAPNEFIPIAEQTTQIGDLTAWVLRTAIAQCARWAAAGTPLAVSVNLSVRNLLDFQLPRFVVQLLEEYDVAPSQLTLEITETHLMADPGRTRKVLADFHRGGVRLSIDDFGTGYSSLSYLKELPVHEVKIDRSFIVGIAGDDNDIAIARAIVGLGRNLGLDIVAEGVEDEASWRQVEQLGCHLVQGYYLARPMTAGALERWLAARHRASSAA